MNVVRTKTLDSGDLLALIQASMTASNNINVTPARAIKVPEVMACINVISQSMSQLPFSIFEKTETTRRKVTDSDVYKVLGQKPNDYQPPLEFFRQMTYIAAWQGNAYARIVRRSGKLIGLIPFEAGQVTAKQRDTGEIYYEVKGSKGKQKTELTSKEVFHLRGPICPRGWISESPIAIAKESIATMAAIDSFTAKYFNGGAKAKGAFRLGEGALTDEEFDRLKTSLNANSENDVAPLLENGLEFIKMDYNARESMLAEITGLTVNKIARVYRVQPHLIQELANATYSNIEHQSKEFLDHTLMPWIRLWESAIKMQLMDPYNDAVYPKFSVQALLRGDNKTRSDTYARAVGGPYMTANQARALEEMDPIEGGDELYLPANYSGELKDEANSTQ